MSDSVTKNTRDLIAFLLRESDLLRSPVFFFILLTSASRTAMIFLINETAERGGPDIWMLIAMLTSVAIMLSTAHLAKMSGVRLVQGLMVKLRRRITQRILDADVSFFQSHAHGKVFHSATGHLNNVSNTALRIVEISQAVLLLIFCLGYLLWQMPASVVAMVLALFFGIGAFFVTQGPATRAVTKSHQATVAYYDSVNDLLHGYKELRLRRSRRNDLAARIDAQIDDARAMTLTSERHYSYGQTGGTGALAALLMSIVVVLPAIAGADSVTMLQILTLVLFSFGPIETVVGDLPMLARAAVSYKEVKQLEADLDKNAEHQLKNKAIDNRPGFDSLELRGVVARLSRDVGDDKTVKDTFTLGPIDLTLYPGQSVFITGGNGMGKSTLLQLLTGLRHPDEGQILLDGEEISRANVADYRGVFAAVFSEFYMFRQLYGLTRTEQERMLEHIKELGLSEGVSIVDGEFTNLSLSTGQRRRLALSIALAEKRPIIVLDEFAADQDPTRRAFFYDVLVPRLAKDGHCVVAVTHDEHCFGKADRLIRVEDGRIAYDELRKPEAITS